MKDCHECKDYRDCNGHFYMVETEESLQYVNWYHYGEIRWCLYQVMFIIENAVTLEKGEWPSYPVGSSYTDPLIKTGYKSEGYYVKPVEMLAEVEYRLERTGVDGKLLRSQVEGGKKFGDMEPEAKDALMYVKGRWRKSLSYQGWKKQVKYRGPG